MSDPDNYVLRDQYSSKDNITAHEETTGPEIWKQTDGKLTTLILAPGTGGTIIGSARYLKSRNPEIEIIAVQPQKEHHIQGIRNFKESMKPIIFKDNEHLIDDYIEISDREALEGTAHLWRRGHYEGTSSGLNYAAARKIARKRSNALITTLFPDSYINSHRITQNFLASGEIAPKIQKR
jgi:cysteine synthase